MRSSLLAVLFAGVVAAEPLHVAPRATGPAAYGGSNSFMGVQACGVALQALAQVSAFCTSYVGGVKTKTVSALQTQNVVATRTNTATIVVTPATKYATLSTTTTSTVSAPTSTITTLASVLTATITQTVTTTLASTQYSAGQTCNANPFRKRDNLLEPRFGVRPIGQFAPAIISQACSSYIIKTPTVTSTQTIRVTSTSQVAETTRTTKPTLTSTRLVTATDKSIITPLSTTTTSVIGFTETVTSTVTIQQTPIPVVCNTASGLECQSGTCTCPSTATQCNGICGTSFKCPGQWQGLGLTGGGIDSQGRLVCPFGYGGSDPAFGGYVVCYYDNVSGAAVESRGYGNSEPLPPANWGCNFAGASVTQC